METSNGLPPGEEAEAKAAQVEYFLLPFKQELITLPPGVAIVQFLEGDGRAGRGPYGPTSTPSLCRLTIRAAPGKDQVAA